MLLSCRSCRLYVKTMYGDAWTQGLLLSWILASCSAGDAAFSAAFSDRDGPAADQPRVSPIGFAVVTHSLSSAAAALPLSCLAARRRATSPRARRMIADVGLEGEGLHILAQRLLGS
jgi:hypothetical protein